MTLALEEVSGQQRALAALYPRERHGTHFTGGWVDPRAGLDRLEISQQNPNVHDHNHKSRSFYLSWACSDQSIFSYTISLKSILIYYLDQNAHYINSDVYFVK